MTYICTHKDFTEYIGSRDGYTILSSVPLKGKYHVPVEVVKPNILTPMQYAYAEGYHIFHLWWQERDDEWIGINQYRKYFDDVPANRTILPIPRRYNMYKQYAQAHNACDLNDCLNIIDELYPEYQCDYKSLQLMPCNMFVMRKADFDNYCDFIFGVLGEFNNRHGLHTDEDVFSYVERRYWQYGQGHDVKYQSRLHGFLMERLGTIFFHTYFGVVNRKVHIVGERI